MEHWAAPGDLRPLADACLRLVDRVHVLANLLDVYVGNGHLRGVEDFVGGHTRVARGWSPTATTCSKTLWMFSLRRMVLARMGAPIRPSLMRKESATTLPVKSPAAAPLMG